MTKKNKDALKNRKVAEYENALYGAEKAMDNVNRALWNLRGPFPRYDIGEITEKIRDLIRGAYRFYDNDEVELAD